MIERRAIPAKLQERMNNVKNKRARFVLDKILENGSVSTIDLKNAGYDHPPRAARDVIELGIALKRIKAKRDDGQTIAAYVLDERELDPTKTGRIVLSKKERDAIICAKGSKCNLCGAKENIQVDHRIPFEIAGEILRDESDPFQLLDGSCNRKKSWACESCKNRQETRLFDTCRSCYWASPESYTHVSMIEERRVEVVWTGNEAAAFDQLKQTAKIHNHSVAEEIKAVFRQN